MYRRLVLALSAALLIAWAGSASGQTVPAGGWTADATIGSADPGSSISPQKGVYEVSGNGNDIWGSADAFQYLYKELTGDGSMTARVVDDGTGSNTWAKGGVMIRQSTEAGSVHSMMVMTASDGNGASWQGRLTPDTDSENTDASSTIDEPYWVRIERVGDEFSGFISPDGEDWTQIGSARTIVMEDPVLIGLAVTSHAAGELRTFTFDNVSFTGDVSGEKDPGSASGASPSDEAMDVAYDTVLRWMAGAYPGTHDIYLGTAFDDVNDAGRSNPMGVLVSQGQSDTSYTPSMVLNFDQTYYWRVDEVNSVGNAIFKGDIWSFTVEPFVYPIEGISASSNVASIEGTGPDKTVDGSGLDAADQHSTESADMWLSVITTDQVSLLYEFDRVYKLYEMLVWNYNVIFEAALGFGLKDVTIEYSADGVEWTILGDVVFARGTTLPGYAANTTVAFGGVPAQYVRLTVNSGYGSLGQFGLSEVRFMHVPAHPREPQPADGATDVSVASPLTWRAGREAATHEVSLGTDPNALTLAGAVDVASYAPGALDLETTYYWQVNEVNDADAVSVWEGEVWTFATQPFLVVDDFENYTDDEGSRIYESWLDGYGVTDNGSQVGNLDAPFAEQTIVKSGEQSMPLFFENNGTSISEAELTLAQDWTASRIQSLAIAFAGDAGNSSAQLYVKINGARIDYDGAAGDLTKTTWQAWNIDLSTVGGNLSNVTSLIIGIEGAGASGVLYIDDIRLYPKEPEYITPVEPDATNLVAHYTFDEGSGTTVGDASGNGNDGAIGGDPIWTTGILGGALQFSGNDYVDCGNDASLKIRDALTVACWVKIGAFVNNWETIIGMGDDSYRMSRSAETGNSIHFGCNGTTTGGNFDATAIVTDNVWHHVALVYDGANKYIYVDGIESASTPTTGQIAESSYNLYIGENSQQAGRYLHGLVDDARIYSRALSPEEVAGLAGRTGLIHKPF